MLDDSIEQRKAGLAAWSVEAGTFANFMQRFYAERIRVLEGMRAAAIRDDAGFEKAVD